MRESASTDLREPQGSNPLGPPGRNVGFEMEAVGRGDEMASIATIVGGLGPGVLWLCQIMLAIERDLVAKTG